MSTETPNAQAIADTAESTVEFIRYAAEHADTDALPALLIAINDTIADLKNAARIAEERWSNAVDIGEGVVIGGRTVVSEMKYTDRWDNVRLANVLAARYADDNGLDRDGNPIPPAALLAGFVNEMADAFGLRAASRAPAVGALKKRNIDPNGPWHSTVPRGRAATVSRRTDD